MPYGEGKGHYYFNINLGDKRDQQSIYVWMKGFYKQSKWKNNNQIQRDISRVPRWKANKKIRGEGNAPVPRAGRSNRTGFQDIGLVDACPAAARLHTVNSAPAEACLSSCCPSPHQQPRSCSLPYLPSWFEPAGPLLISSSSGELAEEQLRCSTSRTTANLLRSRRIQLTTDTHTQYTTAPWLACHCMFQPLDPCLLHTPTHKPNTQYTIINNICFILPYSVNIVHNHAFPSKGSVFVLQKLLEL